jgi:hypothetical protein
MTNLCIESAYTENAEGNRENFHFRLGSKEGKLSSHLIAAMEVGKSENIKRGECLCLFCKGEIFYSIQLIFDEKN